MSKVNKSVQNKAGGLIPTLRFPEFMNEGEWKEKKLGEIAELTSSKRVHLADYVSSGVPFFRGKEISQLKNNQTLEDILYIPNEQYNEIKEKYGVPEKGDILITAVGTLGNVYCIKDDSPFYFKDGNLIWMKNITIASIFLEVLLDVEKEKILSSAIGSSQKALTMAALNKLEVQIPKNPNEQQKIASCLSSLDEVISTQSQKLELLKDHKKGLMQNLFPQEGEKVPKYRFKEFEKDGEWVFDQFDKVYAFLVTNSFSREFLNYDNGLVKNIHYGDIHTKFSTHFDITKEKVPFINSNISIERIREECYCIERDIIFADASEDLNDVGKSIEIVNLNGQKLLSGLHTLLARQIDKKLEIGFGGHLFKTDMIRRQIQSEAQGAKVLGISGTRISNIKIYYPKNPKEQQKIVSCLSSLDALITAQAEKIEQLKLHKKGLMQGLFPKMKE